MSSFKIGDIIICVDNCSYSRSSSTDLTLNKVYTVINIEKGPVSRDNYYVTIIDDDNVECSYVDTRFKLLSEIREEKLNILLAKNNIKNEKGR